MANDYEMTYILRPSLEETEVDERANAIAESVKTLGGEIVGDLEKLGKRRLAYEIDDVREGYYVVMHYKATAVAEKELERQLRLNEAVLRHLPIKKDPRQASRPRPQPLTPPQAPAQTAT